MADDGEIPVVEGEVLPAHTMYNQPKVTDGEIWEALEQNEGNVAAAARALGMLRNKLQERIDRKPELIQLLQDIREETVDIAENNQMKRARSGADPNAERFVLSTLGRKRGYSTAVTGSGANGEIVVEIRKIADGD